MPRGTRRNWSRLQAPFSYFGSKWNGPLGFANRGSDGAFRANRQRETVWFSPHCLKPAS